MKLEPGSEFVATVIAETIPAEEAGLLIGRYKLLEKLGEGGFGAVWLAEQKEPVRRKVALKIIKLGMDTKQLWDTASLQELLTLEAEGSTYYQTAFSPDGALIDARNAQGVLHLWRAPSWEEIAVAERSKTP